MAVPLAVMLAGIAALAFGLGAVLGYAANGSGATWRRRFETERDYYALYRTQCERARLASGRRIAELERAASAPPDDVRPRPAPIHDETTAQAVGTLTRIRGIDEGLAVRLAALGVSGLQDIETLSAQDEMALELRLGLAAGRIAHDQWRLQATLLARDEADSAVHAPQFVERL